MPDDGEPAMKRREEKGRGREGGRKRKGGREGERERKGGREGGREGEKKQKKQVETEREVERWGGWGRVGEGGKGRGGSTAGRLLKLKTTNQLELSTISPNPGVSTTVSSR